MKRGWIIEEKAEGADTEYGVGYVNTKKYQVI